MRLAVAEVLDALADKNRRNILPKLKKADLIYETREKNFIYYELDLSILDETILWITQLRGEKNNEK